MKRKINLEENFISDLSGFIEVFNGDGSILETKHHEASKAQKV